MPFLGRILGRWELWGRIRDRRGWFVASIGSVEVVRENVYLLQLGVSTCFLA